MDKYAVISDSACDLPSAIVKQNNIDIVPFTVSFDRKNKLTEGIDISNDEFYRKLQASDIMPKTYFPTVGDYVDRFKKRLEQGQDILCLCLSSKLSKSYNSALNAKRILSYTYPNSKIVIIDTMMASAGQGLLVLDAAKLRESAGVEAASEKIEAVKKTALSIVTVASLDQLARGGRMSSTSAIFGKLLRINPVIFLENGVLVSKHKALGRWKALELIKKLTAAEIGANPNNFDFSMLHSKSIDEATAVARDMNLVYGVKQTIPPVELGATIGMHTGASVVATAFARKI